MNLDRLLLLFYVLAPVLAAILPVTWSPMLVYFGITIILGLIDWTGLARAVRSRLLSLREEDFCVAAQLMGASPGRIIFRHMAPNVAAPYLIMLTAYIAQAILLGAGLVWILRRRA